MSSAQSDLPRISVVVPSYNQASYLETALLSILGQSYPNTELIVVDGGSTDSSLEIIARHESSIAMWRSHPDHGQADAISEGLSFATGDILCYLNSDDMYLPGAFQRVAGVLGRSPARPGWVVGANIRVDAVGRMTRFDLPLKVSLHSMLLWGSGFAQPAAFWNRSLYEAAGGIDQRLEFCLDYDMFLRFVSVTRPQVLYAYVAAFRDHPMSKSATLMEVHASELRALKQRYGRPRGAVRRVAFMSPYWARWKALRVRAVVGKRPRIPPGWPSE